MKRVLRVILALAFIIAFILFVFFLAKRSRTNLEAALPLAARTVLIAPTAQQGTIACRRDSGGFPARILPLWDEVLLDTIDMNLTRTLN